MLSCHPKQLQHSKSLPIGFNRIEPSLRPSFVLACLSYTSLRIMYIFLYFPVPRLASGRSSPFAKALGLGREHANHPIRRPKRKHDFTSVPRTDAPARRQPATCTELNAQIPTTDRSTNSSTPQLAASAAKLLGMAKTENLQGHDGNQENCSLVTSTSTVVC